MTSITQNMSGLGSEDNEQHINPNDPVKYTSEYSPHKTDLDNTQSMVSQHQASSATNANNGFLSGATETLASAGETAKQYLPTSVVSTLQNVGVMSHDTSVTSTTLPSQETQFAGSRGGVGTLPGTRSETEVAKLPDEKKYEEEVGHPLGREGVMGTQAEEGRIIGLADSLLEHNKRVNPTAGTNTAAKFINLDAIPTPDPETPSGMERDRTLHHIPDERPLEHKTEPPMPLQNGPAGMQSQRKMDKSVDKPLPPPGGNINAPATSELDKGRSDTTYADDQARRKAPNTEPSMPPSTDHKEHVEQKKDTGESHTADSKNTTSKKPSITQKIKGEVKVISGKLSNNPSKVEAGQALKKGTT